MGKLPRLESARRMCAKFECLSHNRSKEAEITQQLLVHSETRLYAGLHSNYSCCTKKSVPAMRKRITFYLNTFLMFCRLYTCTCSFVILVHPKISNSDKKLHQKGIKMRSRITEVPNGKDQNLFLAVIKKDIILLNVSWSYYTTI